jgi:hypothetical protein
MGLAGKIWRWGVVVPVSVAAFAGAAADIVTDTLNYWWLLAPSYPVIGVATWRGMDPRILRLFGVQQRADRLAEADRRVELAETWAKEYADAHPPPDDEVATPHNAAGAVNRPSRPPPAPVAALEQPALVEVMAPARPVTVGGLLRGLWEGAMRLLATVSITFIWMVCIWGAIAIGTWARPYWYIYVPGISVVVILGLLIWRMGAPTKAERDAERAGKQDALVR